MRRMAAILIVAVAVALAPYPAARAVGADWHSEQPVAAGIGVPVSLGKVGGMAFWSPNKGVLVTGGIGTTPPGVYAYDGSGWYLYSTVCAGRQGGGIAISGPDEFWTIADYGEHQEGINGAESAESDRTLCHFANGEVVASYAEPAASPDAFEEMSAAACEGPTNCWFGGVAAPQSAPNQDPFHLHWNGEAPIPVPSRTFPEPEVAQMPGNVESLAFAQGRLFETASQAPYLREITLGDPRRFLSAEPLAGTSGPFVLSTDPLQQQLWAASRSGAVLHLGPGGFETLTTETPVFDELGGIAAIGAEPGTQTAWLGGGFDAAEVRRVNVDGTLGPSVQLPQPSEELNPKGRAEHIVCPASNQCWMVTEKGWLFHLGGPPAEGVNTDPLMHRLITSRPKDASSRTLVPAGLPPDDSGETELRKVPNERVEPFPEPRPRKSIVYDVHQKMLGKLVLELSFKLRARAHVQLLAKYHGKVVAKTPQLTLGKGPHKLHLKLDPKRWPTGLAFPVHAVKKRSSE